jgi:hypothetical protein
MAVAVAPPLAGSLTRLIARFDRETAASINLRKWLVYADVAKIL